MLPLASLLPVVGLVVGGSTLTLDESACSAGERGPVVIRSVGMGQLAALDGSCARWLAESPQLRSVVHGPAAEIARQLVAPAQAQAALDELRAEDVVTGAGTFGPYSDRSLSLLEDGELLAQAAFLRELYATGGASEDQREAIEQWEAVVLPELAFVLGLDEAELLAEMRLRHRAR